jgi:acetyl-CoA carboxylase biotin carboxyl carrier protein
MGKNQLPITNYRLPITFKSNLTGSRFTVALDFNELRQLLAVLAQTDITELTLKSADFELTVRKGNSTSGETTPTALHPGLGYELGSHTPASIEPKKEAISAPPSTPPTSTPPGTQSGESKWVAIGSPMVGTFYRAPAPNEPPFVEVGDRIRVGQTVCIIEAMKLMNEIEAEVSGQVMEIAIANATPVEFGQVLMRINPD